MTMAAFAITAHAIQRWTERVEPISHDEAAERLMSCRRAVLAAESIGCQSVRLGNGARLVLQGATIVTVYPSDRRTRYFRPRCLRTGRGHG